MKKMSDYIKWYVYITTSILIVCAVCFTLSDGDMIPAKTLWQILLSGLFTALVTGILHEKECKKKSTAIIRHLSHYILLCIVMILCGKWFGWLDFDFGGIIMMAVLVAVVYLLTFCVYYIIDLKQAREINRKLKEKYNDSSESL